LPFVGNAISICDSIVYVQYVFPNDNVGFTATLVAATTSAGTGPYGSLATIQGIVVNATIQ